MPPPAAGGGAETFSGAVVGTGVGGTGVAVGGTGVAVAVAVGDGDGVSVGEGVAVADGDGVAVRVLSLATFERGACCVVDASGEDEATNFTCAPLGDEQADATSTKARAARRMRDRGFHRLIVA
jgi:hypothetical protein